MTRSGASRRGVIQLLGASFVLAAPSATAASKGREIQAQRVLIDERYAESRVFAQSLIRRGASAWTFSGDLTDLWLHELGPLWKSSLTPLAGLTGRDALFVLEQLARGAGLRVLARAEPTGRSGPTAWLIGPARSA